MQTTDLTPEHSSEPTQVARSTAALPPWLQQLATESWQAELLISGFAIVGTGQLVGFIEPMADWALWHLRTDYVGFFRYALYYLAIGFVILPCLFIVHFGLRTYWVGLVSLSSVFPDGFGKNYGVAPAYVVADIERRSPTLVEQIDVVERRASIMFAVAALLAMMFTAIAITILGTLGASVLVERLSGGRVGFRTVYYVISGLFLLLFVVTTVMLKLKRYHGRPGFQRVQLGLSDLSSTLLYTVLKQPATYLSTLLTTNASMKRLVGPIIIGYVILTAAVSVIVYRPAAFRLMRYDQLAEAGLAEHRHLEERYEAEWPAEPNARVIYPYVASEHVAVDGGRLDIHIPILGEDDYRMDERRGDLEQPNDTDDAEWRRRRSLLNLAAAEEYYRVRLGERVLVPEEMVWAPRTGQGDAVRISVVLPEGVRGRQYLYVDVRASTLAAEKAFEGWAVVPVLVDRPRD